MYQCSTVVHTCTLKSKMLKCMKFGGVPATLLQQVCSLHLHLLLLPHINNWNRLTPLLKPCIASRPSPYFLFVSFPVSSPVASNPLERVHTSGNLSQTIASPSCKPRAGYDEDGITLAASPCLTLYRALSPVNRVASRRN